MQHFILKVKAITNAPKFQILGFNNCNELKIKVKSPPAKNRANLEIMRELSKKFNAEIKIIKGLKSNRKEIWIGISEAEFWEKLGKIPKAK